MKNMLYRLCRVILTMFGFSAAASCAVEYGTPPILCEYGTPTMDFRVSGTVRDSETEKPIENIAVTLIEFDDYERPDTVWTDADGRFEYESYGFPDDKIKLKFSDVDFYDNGGYFENTIEEIPLLQVSEGSGAWYDGKYVAEDVNVMLNPVYETACMYGTPYVEFSVKGRVVDSENNPIEGIEVSAEEGMQKVLTAKDGSFHYVGEMIGFELQELELTFTDIDGEDNGGEFETKTVTVPVTQTDPGEGSWDNGDYEGEVDVVLGVK